jgi:hypothetical protein
MSHQVNIREFHFLPIQYIYVLYGSHNKRAVIYLYHINGLVFKTETGTVYCDVRTESLHIIQAKLKSSTLFLTIEKLFINKFLLVTKIPHTYQNIYLTFVN